MLGDKNGVRVDGRLPIYIIQIDKSLLKAKRMNNRGRMLHENVPIPPEDILELGADNQDEEYYPHRNYGRRRTGYDILSKILSVNNANTKTKRKVEIRHHRSQHPSELEHKLLELTSSIKSGQIHLLCNKKDKFARTRYMTDLVTRRRLLRFYSQADFERYAQFITDYNIPPLESPKSRANKYAFRTHRIGRVGRKGRIMTPTELEYYQNY
ncbi:hypothetical protein RF11_10808 [Thelohanellus kitauei]|uniref:Uncharacterized protein n=1 Tax=Thelohanellus kitauei TaxID=669202 RepID=A0A0C2MWA5_THEKT|nr:hypothetical protein RF11_10808 [Thelohanellus kitauei]